MSSRSGSVHSFDNESDLTLLNGDVLEEHDGCQHEKTAYGVDQNPYFAATSVPLSLSSSWTARCLACTRSLLWVLIPSFLCPSGRAPVLKGDAHPTAYLDGMRGMAAFAVFLCHLSYGTWDISHIYGAGDLGENAHLLQLPIIRLLYAGPSMVAIFFVISGYALSYRSIKLMRARRHEEFMLAMTSSIFRRALRLFLPCFASTFMVAVFCQLGFYKKTEAFAHNMRIVSEEHAWTQPNTILQLLDWIQQLGHFVNMFDWSLYAGSIALDRHLWTIPTEFRCSMALFLTLMMTARMSTKVRTSAIIVLIWWGMHWNRWELIPFWSGAILAELELTDMSNQAYSLDDDPSIRVRSRNRPMWNCSHGLIFTGGLYLASFPDADGHTSPGYMLLNSLIPEYWTEKHRFWPTIAAVQIVWSVSKLEHLRTLFTCPLLQHLGQISFPLYVVHGPIIHTFGYAVMDKIYGHTDAQDTTNLEIKFAMSAIMIVVVVIWVSDIFWRLIDQPCVRFTKWLENRLLVS